MRRRSGIADSTGPSAEDSSERTMPAEHDMYQKEAETLEHHSVAAATDFAMREARGGS